MKLTGKLDAAVWFDMLSILQVKTNKIKNFEKFTIARKSCREMFDCLEAQLSPQTMSEIVNSIAYINLYKVNLKIFEIVDFAEDKTKRDITSAYGIIQLNLLRYHYKQELQKEFFGDEIEEVKTGKYVI